MSVKADKSSCVSSSFHSCTSHLHILVLIRTHIKKILSSNQEREFFKSTLHKYFSLVVFFCCSLTAATPWPLCFLSPWRVYRVHFCLAIITLWRYILDSISRDDANDPQRYLRGGQDEAAQHPGKPEDYFEWLTALAHCPHTKVRSWWV